MKKIDIKNLVCPHVLNMQAYSSARMEYEGKEGVFLDANENSLGSVTTEVHNRYPDPLQADLKTALAKTVQLQPNQIFLGNGSDECINVLIQCFCIAGKDKVIILPPSFSMYEHASRVMNIGLIEVMLKEETFQLNVDEILKLSQDNAAKIIFICSPNNPTGNSINGIEEILKSFNGGVVVDEAYIDFSEKESWLKRLNEFPNLIISQTFSKAWGLAAARVGLAYTNPELISWFNKVKPPYNVSELNQQEALKALEQKDETLKKINLIKSEKIELERNLDSLEIVKKVYPSDGNFLLVEVSDANKVYEYLTDEKIVVRNRNSVVKNCLRITVGAPEENVKMLNALQNYKS